VTDVESLSPFHTCVHILTREAQRLKDSLF